MIYAFSHGVFFVELIYARSNVMQAQIKMFVSIIQGFQLRSYVIKMLYCSSDSFMQILESFFDKLLFKCRRLFSVLSLSR